MNKFLLGALCFLSSTVAFCAEGDSVLVRAVSDPTTVVVNSWKSRLLVTVRLEEVSPFPNDDARSRAATTYLSAWINRTCYLVPIRTDESGIVYGFLLSRDSVLANELTELPLSELAKMSINADLLRKGYVQHQSPSVAGTGTSEDSRPSTSASHDELAQTDHAQNAVQSTPLFAGQKLSGRVTAVYPWDGTIALTTLYGKSLSLRFARIVLPERNARFGQDALSAAAHLLVGRMLTVEITELEANAGRVTIRGITTYDDQPEQIPPDRELVRLGLATLSPEFADDPELQAELRDAKANGRGMWLAMRPKTGAVRTTPSTSSSEDLSPVFVVGTALVLICLFLLVASVYLRTKRSVAELASVREDHADQASPKSQCPACGVNVYTEARFCGRCGAALQRPDGKATPEYPPTRELRPQTAHATYGDQPFLDSRKNNGVAATGFWLGIASVFLYWIGILPLLGLIFSIVGLATFRPEIHKNRWMAITGIVLGVLYTLMALAHWGHLR